MKTSMGECCWLLISMALSQEPTRVSIRKNQAPFEAWVKPDFGAVLSYDQERDLLEIVFAGKRYELEEENIIGCVEESKVPYVLIWGLETIYKEKQALKIYLEAWA